VIRELGRRLPAGGGCQQQPRCEHRQDYTEQANKAHTRNLAVNPRWGGRGSKPSIGAQGSGALIFLG